MQRADRGQEVRAGQAEETAEGLGLAATRHEEERHVGAVERGQGERHPRARRIPPLRDLGPALALVERVRAGEQGGGVPVRPQPEECEVDPSRPCTWYEIYEKSMKMGREDRLLGVEHDELHRLVLRRRRQRPRALP